MQGSEKTFVVLFGYFWYSNVEWGWVNGDVISLSNYITTATKYEYSLHYKYMKEARGRKKILVLFWLCSCPTFLWQICMYSVYLYAIMFYMFYMCVGGGCMKLVCFCVCIFFCIPPSQGSPKLHSVEDECSKRPRCSVHIFLHNASFKRNEKFTPIVKL